MLASCASEVIALDETRLDHMNRRVPIVRHVKKGDLQFFPGKLVSLCDVRLQQWRTIEALVSVSENGREHACQVVYTVKKGALILADLGSVGVRWCDELTERGESWITRLKESTTLVVLQTSDEAGYPFDRLVWLGVGASKATDAVRHIQFRQGGVLRQYLTTVCTPTIVPLPEMARLSAPRWESEVAVVTLTREVGVHLIWRNTFLVVQAHVRACLIMAHVMQTIRMDVALRAEVDAFDVSLPILCKTVPQWQWDERDGIDDGAPQGRRLGILRPSTRLRVQTPLISLPHGTILCRHPFSGKPTCEDAPNDPALDQGRARDRVAALLFQREAHITALKRLAQTASPPQPKPVPPQMKLHRGRPSPVVEPDPTLVPPSLAFQQPFIGLPRTITWNSDEAMPMGALTLLDTALSASLDSACRSPHGSFTHLRPLSLESMGHVQKPCLSISLNCIAAHWEIEVFFSEGKEELGLKHFHMLSVSSLQQCWTLAMLVSVFLGEGLQQWYTSWQRPVSTGEAQGEIQGRHCRCLLAWSHNQSPG